MKFPVSARVAQLPFPPISEVKGWLAGRVFPEDRPLVDLCQAVPDYPPAAELTDHLKGLLSDPLVSKYTPDEGLPEVREAVCARYRRMYGAGPSGGQICLTVGASQAFWLAMVVLCREGDEVIVQLPAYFDHPMALGALGIRPVYARPAGGGSGLSEAEALAKLVTPRTRAILLVSPSNPTGAVLAPATLRRIFELAREKNIALVLDETYNAFIDGPSHGLFSDPAWTGHFVHLASFGKTYALTGFRAGALVASEGFIRQALKVQDTMAVCQPRITQEALRYGCDALDGWVASKRAVMQRRHQRFREEFLRPGNPFGLAASGGFFAWVTHPWEGETSRSAARRLADEANIACLPGAAFGPGLEGFLRLAFGNIREEQIPAAAARFRDLPR